MCSLKKKTRLIADQSGKWVAYGWPCLTNPHLTVALPQVSPEPHWGKYIPEIPCRSNLFKPKSTGEIEWLIRYWLIDQISSKAGKFGCLKLHSHHKSFDPKLVLNTRAYSCNKKLKKNLWYNLHIMLNIILKQLLTIFEIRIKL